MNDEKLLKDEKLPKPEFLELLRCALSPTGMVRVSKGGRSGVLAALVDKGFLRRLMPASPDIDRYSVADLGLKSHALLCLTIAGKAFVLALNPSDYTSNDFYPFRVDCLIQQAHDNLGG